MKIATGSNSNSRPKHVTMTCRSQGLWAVRSAGSSTVGVEFRSPTEAVILAGRNAKRRRCYVIDVTRYVTSTALPLSVSRHIAP